MIELLAAADLLREYAPELKVRFVCVTDLFTLARPEAHPHGMSEGDFNALFTVDKPVIFNFHGYASAVHQLIHRRPVQERFSVRGYAEEGTTTTPFELLAMNGVDRFQLAIDAISRTDVDRGRGAAGRCPGSSRCSEIGQANEAIETLKKRRQELREYVTREGNDPPEILEWTWHRPTAAPAS